MDKINQLKVLCTVLKQCIVPLLTNNPHKSMVYVEIVDTWYALFRHNVKSNGIPYALNENKLLRLSVTRFISGNPISPSDLGKSQIGLLKCGLPKKLKKIVALDFRNKEDLRFILTLLNIPRALQVETFPDYSPITDEWKGSDQSISNYEIKRSIKTLIPRSLLKDNDISFKRFHLSSKTSPSGNPVLPSSVEEARIIVNKYPHLAESISKLAGEKLLARLNLCAEYGGSGHSKYLSKKIESISRVASIPDKEGKTRNIAILDYWTQTSLHPLNEYIFRILKQIPTDLTFDQGDIPFSQISESSTIYSYDLSSATDRFPISFQKRVLEIIIGKEKAQAWCSLLTQREYNVQGVKKTATLNYKCGQPLGAFSSWPIFTLCHHVVLLISMSRTGITYAAQDFPYRILGDDIIIWNDRVAENYSIIMKELDVGLSKAKSHLSSDTFELAKRWFCKLNGTITEITGFPMAGLITAKNQPVYFSSYFKTAINHGWTDYSTVLVQPDVVKSFIQTLGGTFSKGYFKEFAYSLYGVSSIDSLDAFVKAFVHLNPYCSDYEGKRFKGLVRDAFIVAKMVQLNRDLIKVQVSSLFQETSSESMKIKDWFDSNRQGSSALPGGLFKYSEAVPYVQVWDDTIYSFNLIMNDYITAASEYDQYSDVPVAKKTIDQIFSDRSYSAVLSAPNLNRINRLTKNQEVLLTTVKITKAIIHIITSQGVQNAFESISTPWEQSWD